MRRHLSKHGHESRAEEEGNQAKTGLGEWLGGDGSVVGGGGRSSAGAGARSLGGRGSASGGRIESSIAEDIVEVVALAGEAGLELVDILTLGETVDPAVIVVFGDFGIFAAGVHHIGHIPPGDGGTGSIGGGDLPDAAAAGSAGCADGCGGG